MYNVSIEFNGYTVTGWADLCGPYAECEGSEVTSIVKPGYTANLMPIMQDSFIEEALSAVEAAAYKKHQAAFAGHSRDDDYDYEDTYTDYCSSRGGDYWQDPESGEYRCG